MALNKWKYGIPKKEEPKQTEKMDKAEVFNQTFAPTLPFVPTVPTERRLDFNQPKLIESDLPKTTKVTAPITGRTFGLGNVKTYQAPIGQSKKELDIKDKVEKKEAKETAETLQKELTEKYGFKVKRANSPIEYANILLKVPANQKEQFKKDYDAYIITAERSNPFRAGAEAGFNILPTNLEKTQGKEVVEEAKGFGSGRFVGGAGQQLAFNSVLGAPIEGLVGKVLPKATPLITETIKDVAIGTGAQLVEAPFDKPTAGQFVGNAAMDVALNVLFGAVGKGLSKIDLFNLRSTKPKSVVTDVARELGVSEAEADKVLYDAIDFYVNQYGTASPNQFEQLQLPAPEFKPEFKSDTFASTLRNKTNDIYVNQFGVADTKPFEQLQLDAPKNIASDTSASKLSERIKDKKLESETKLNLTPTVYHGTGESFEKFDKKMQGSNYRTGTGGFFFTNNERSAGNYAKISAKNVNGKERIISAKLDMKNPLVLGPYDDAFDFYDNHITDILRSAEEGVNDGIIIKSTDGKRDLYVPLDENQIIQDIKQSQPDRPSEFSIGKPQYPPLAKPFAKDVINPVKPKLNAPVKEVARDFTIQKPTYPPLAKDFAREVPKQARPRIEPTLKPVAEDIGTVPQSARLDVQLPKQEILASKSKPSEPNVKFRKTITNSFQKSEMPEEAKVFFDANPREYEVYTNKDSWDKAFEKVSNNVESSKNEFLSKTSLDNANDTAEAIAVLNRVANEGNIEELIRLTDNFAEKSTRAGQAVQAIVMLQRTTPEGKLVQAQNIIKNIDDELKKFPGTYEKLKSKGKLPTLTVDDATFIVDTMKKAQDLTGRAKQLEIAKVDQLLADKIPAAFGDKLRALRNMSLLGNFKTIAIRNPLGNLIFSGLENLSQIPSGLTDKLVSGILKSQRTTKVIPDIQTQLSGFKKGIKEAAEDIVNNVDTSPTRGGAELPRNRKVFETAWLNKANNWLGNALKMGDRPFYQAAYEARLKELTELMPNADIKELEKIASEFGLERTFQNMGKTAEALAKIKTGMNTANIKGFGFGDVVMPYTQTPANILAKGVEYTPLNIIKLAKIVFGSGQGGVGKNIVANQKSFVDAVGRMFTGTGAATLGYLLAKNGYVTGKTTDTSSKAKELKKSVGQQQYSLKVGDKWYSYDWAQPASIPIALGIDFYNAGMNEDEFITALNEGVISSGETLLNQGVMQGIMRMFGGYSPVENVIETLAAAPTQLLPTLGSQVGQITDPYKRDVDYSNPLDLLKTSVAKKIPGLRQNLPSTLNMFGEPIKEQSGETGINKILLSMFSPSLVSKETTDPVLQETNRLFKSVKETDVIPSYTPSALSSKEDIRNFKLVYGPMAKDTLTNLFNSNAYKTSTDEVKAKLVGKQLNALKSKAKDAYNSKYKTDLR